MTHDWEATRRALAEAQAWVVGRLPLGHPAEVLRSLALGECLEEYPDRWYGTIASVSQIAELIERRAQLLEGLPRAKISREGKILCAFDGWDTSMGEGVPASDGIIDYTYFPPWDTWFAVVKLIGIPMEDLVLLAWIPADLTEQVQAAIEIAATQPIAWLDDVVSSCQV